MGRVSDRVTLTRPERKRIIAGDRSPLVRDRKPTFGPGAGCVLVWSHSRRFADVDGTVFRPPSIPLMALKINRVVRRRQGGWLAHFDIVDRREVRRYLRRTTPSHEVTITQARRNGVWLDRWFVHWGKQSKPFDSRKEAIEFAKRKHAERAGPVNPAEEERARQESAYTTDPSEAVDLLEVVDDETLRRQTDEARQVETLREHVKVGERVQAIESLPPVERVIALAELARERGLDCRDDIKALERRLQRRLGMAA